ncbi:MAG: LysR family transcriptional regulator [Microbacteriaceae bacterium]|nr:MAG: LysR family transcriptional regulator [Microbacteriaceae bacterium]
MQYTLRQLEIFVAVAEAGHFGRAAEALHISQPTVSQEINRLERRLGIPLFDRSRRSATVTPAGEVMLTEGRLLLRRAANLIDKVQLFETSRMRTARVIATPSVVNRLLPAVLSRAEQELPGIQIDETLVETGAVSTTLVDEHADIGIGRFLNEIDGFDLETITDEPVLVAVSRNHPASRERRVSLKDLADLPLLLWPREQNPAYYDYLIELCTSRELNPLVLMSPPLIVGSRLYLLSEGRAFSLVPWSMAGRLSDDLAAIRLDRPATLPLSMQWRADDPRAPLAALRDLIRSEAAILQAEAAQADAVAGER